MTFQKKDRSIKDGEDELIISSFGKDDETPPSTPAAPAVEVFPRYDPNTRSDDDDMCVVLYGYGIVKTDHRQYVDDYLFVGGVGRNIPRTVADAWKRGKRWQDKKPALSRVYIQAILPNDANEVDFAKATGVTPMKPAELAAMIGATDAKTLVAALGRKQAVALAEQLMSNLQ